MDIDRKKQLFALHSHEYAITGQFTRNTSVTSKKACLISSFHAD